MTTARADEIYIFTTILYKKNENKIKKLLIFISICNKKSSKS